MTREEAIAAIKHRAPRTEAVQHFFSMSLITVSDNQRGWSWNDDTLDVLSDTALAELLDAVSS